MNKETVWELGSPYEGQCHYDFQHCALEFT